MAAELILSPAEKQLAAPVLKWLEPDKIAGKKEMVINRPMQIGFEAYDGSWSFFEDESLDYDRLFSFMNLLCERTNQTFNMAKNTPPTTHCVTWSRKARAMMQAAPCDAAKMSAAEMRGRCAELSASAAPSNPPAHG